MAITAVQNAVKTIGIHFVGMTLFKTTAPGIVKYVAPAGIGGSGIVKPAIGVPMACHFLIPFLHIADATARQIPDSGIKKVGLLGTRFTMEEDFYKSRLTEKFGLDVIIPDADAREIVHRVIYDELVAGKIRQDSKERYLNIIQQLADCGAEGIILGCT